MPQEKKPPYNARIAAAALRLAAAKGWANVTLAAVAKAAQIPRAAFDKEFATANALIPVIAAEIDWAAFGGRKFSGTDHDVLFDALMARFDILQKHRKAILSMYDAARRDLSLSRALACATIDGAYRLIDAVKIDTPPRPVLAVGLYAICAWAFLAWRKDSSRDMAKTMAALDRALRLAGKAAGLVTPRS